MKQHNAHRRFLVLVGFFWMAGATALYTVLAFFSTLAHKYDMSTLLLALPLALATYLRVLCLKLPFQGGSENIDIFSASVCLTDHFGCGDIEFHFSDFFEYFFQSQVEEGYGGLD